jgi:hypothetical protein
MVEGGAMGFHAVSVLSRDTDSASAGLALARGVRDRFGADRPAAVLVYATINHDHPVLLAGLREGIGPGVAVVGCSAQGIMANDAVVEGGFVAGAMALGGGALRACTALAEEVHLDGEAKGRSIGQQLIRGLGQQPRLTVLLYDPLGGVDVNHLLAGLRQELSALVVGGAASQPAGPLAGTYQYEGTRTFQDAAVAVGLVGDFDIDLGLCHGTVPTGVVMTLTRAAGNRLLELDGRPALDVWRETVGIDANDTFKQEHIAALPMGIARPVTENGQSQDRYLIRAVFGLDREAGAIIVQAGIPEGSKIMFHHRTVPVVREGTAAMAGDLARRLTGKHPWAVLGFECGGRTAPFLGTEATLEENLELQQAVAPQAPWLGLIAWGEIAPHGGEPEFHNYTYPLVVLSG